MAKTLNRPWGIDRVQGRWGEDCCDDDGTYPAVNGWRVSTQDYMRDPNYVESCAKIIACAPMLLDGVKSLLECVRSDIAVNDQTGSFAGVVDELQQLIEMVDGDESAED